MGHAYIDVRGRSEDVICQFLRFITGDIHNLSVLRHNVVRHLPDNIHLNRMRDHVVLGHMSRMIKFGKFKVVVETDKPGMRTIYGFAVVMVSENIEERRQQEIKSLESRSPPANTAPAKTVPAEQEPLPPQSTEPAVTPSQLANPTPRPVAAVASAPEPEIEEIEESLVYPSPAMLVAAAQDGIPFCEECAHAAMAAAL